MTFIRENLPDPVAYFESQGLTLTKKGKWRTTSCEFHGGSDSMRVKVSTGAFVCMACNARGGDVLAYHRAAHGLQFMEACKALGCWQDDGKPAHHQRPKPLPAADALSVLALEAMIVYVTGCHMARGIAPSAEEKDRLALAVGRIHQIEGMYK